MAAIGIKLLTEMLMEHRAATISDESRYSICLSVGALIRPFVNAIEDDKVVITSNHVKNLKNILCADQIAELCRLTTGSQRKDGTTLQEPIDEMITDPRLNQKAHSIQKSQAVHAILNNHNVYGANINVNSVFFEQCLMLLASKDIYDFDNNHLTNNTPWSMGQIMKIYTEIFDEKEMSVIHACHVWSNTKCFFCGRTLDCCKH